MASDQLIKVGHRISRFQEETKHTSRHTSKNLTSVEKSGDVFGVLYPYTLEFKTYAGHSAYLSIKFGQKFRTL